MSDPGTEACLPAAGCSPGLRVRPSGSGSGSGSTWVSLPATNTALLCFIRVRASAHAPAAHFEAGRGVHGPAMGIGNRETCDCKRAALRRLNSGYGQIPN